MSIDSTDQDLLARVRAGDTAAYGELYAHHSAAAHRAARRISRDPHIAQDLVSESFTRVFKALQADRGPCGDLFPYLLVTMRNVAATWGKSSARWSSVGDDTAFAPRDARDLVAGADEAPVDKMAVSMTTTAFGRLPSRWRTVLWYLEVEGESASEVGQRLGLSDVAVRQLARRAREGLREAYLGAYLGGVAV
nr:sigma-70 family RNA polymerase sigma factor [Actinomycetota bacterium]